MKHVTLDEAIVIHERLLGYGGRRGLRDRGLLESALHAPHATFGGEDLYKDVWYKAAALLLGMTNNHPFVDGNKRTAFLATAILLERNGLELTASPAHAAVFVLALADGSLDEDGFASWLRDHSKRRGGGRTAGRPTKRRKRG